MSRLHTALERRNAGLLTGGVKKPEPELEPPATPALPLGPTRSPEPSLPADPGGQGDSSSERAVVPLPPLLIDTSPSFRREIALLYRSLPMLARKELRSILVCSVERGAGTSTIALNLAAYACQESTGRALLIEANFENPFAYRVSNRALTGFSDLLSNQGAIEEYVNTTSTAGLHLMSAGRITDESSKLVIENRVRYLLAECQHGYPIVVLDGAPLDTSTSTLELAKAVDGVVLVVRPDTLTKTVVQARTALENVGANTLGFAFNDF